MALWSRGKSNVGVLSSTPETSDALHHTTPHTSNTHLNTYYIVYTNVIKNFKATAFHRQLNAEPRNVEGLQPLTWAELFSDHTTIKQNQLETVKTFLSISPRERLSKPRFICQCSEALSHTADFLQCELADCAALNTPLPLRGGFLTAWLDADVLIMYHMLFISIRAHHNSCLNDIQPCCSKHWHLLKITAAVGFSPIYMNVSASFISRIMEHKGKCVNFILRQCWLFCYTSLNEKY